MDRRKSYTLVPSPHPRAAGQSVSSSARVPVRLLESIRVCLHMHDSELERRLLACMPRQGKMAPALARKAARREGHAEETSEIRAAVMARAGGRCEGCGTALCGGGDLQLDHYFGRNRVEQSLETCWALGLRCHREKTDNRPSRLYWARTFEVHLLRMLPSPGRTMALDAIRREISKLQAREKLARQERT